MVTGIVVVVVVVLVGFAVVGGAAVFAVPQAPRASEDMTGVAGDWARPDLPIGGDDVTLLGVAKGPKVGELLRQVEAWWIDQDFPESRRAVLRKLSEAVRGEF